MEQFLERQSTLYVNCVDFHKAFDTVDRVTLLKIMRNYGILDSLKSFASSKAFTKTLPIVSYKVQIYPSLFIVSNIVRQGCLLSPLIFSRERDSLMKEVVSQLSRLQWTFTRQLDLHYADDISLLSNSPNHIQEKIEKLSTIAGMVGLKINVKYDCSAKNDPNMLEDKTAENIESFTCLGSLVN